jgi:hypothetical protein
VRVWGWHCLTLGRVRSQMNYEKLPLEKPRARIDGLQSWGDSQVSPVTALKIFMFFFVGGMAGLGQQAVGGCPFRKFHPACSRRQSVFARSPLSVAPLARGRAGQISALSERLDRASSARKICKIKAKSPFDPAVLLWGFRKRVDREVLPDRRIVVRFELSGVPASRTKYRIMCPLFRSYGNECLACGSFRARTEGCGSARAVWRSDQSSS